MNIGFSGGGARSFAHIGFMKALLEQGYKFDKYSGTSGGCIMAILFANGWSVQDIEEWAVNTDFSKLITWNKLSLLTHLGFPEGLMSNKKLGKVFDDLQNKGAIKAVDNLWINACSFPNFDERIFTKQDFETIGYGDIVRASTAIPGIIQAPTIDGTEYADGGLCSNPYFPPSEEKWLILHLGYPEQGKDPKGWLNNITSAISALQYHRDKLQTACSHKIEVIKIPIKHVKTTDFGMSPQAKRDLIKYGYEQMQLALLKRGNK
jgi:hypothetical protein